MKRVIKNTCKAGGSAVMLGMFWTGAVLIGASIAINYTMNKQKRQESILDFIKTKEQNNVKFY